MRRLLLVLMILVGILIFTGCNIIVTAPDCCILVQSCNLKITAGYGVWGTIKYQVISTGEIIDTGQYIDYDYYNGQPTATVYNMPCGEEILVYIVDNCNYQSHVESMILQPGQQNFLYFAYWKNLDKSKDIHCRC